MKKFLIAMFIILVSMSVLAPSVTTIWNINTETNIVGYHVYLSTNNFTNSTIRTVMHPSNSCVISDLKYNVPYKARVIASNSAELTSNPSSTISFTIQPGLQSMLTNGQITYIFPTGYTLQSSTNLLSWTDVTSSSPYTITATNPYMFYKLRK